MRQSLPRGLGLVCLQATGASPTGVRVRSSPGTPAAEKGGGLTPLACGVSPPPRLRSVPPTKPAE